jgi:hypothetical protein
MPQPRCVVPEALDELAPDDPQAQRSRRDLRRIHRVMGSIAWLKRAIARLPMSRPPRTLIELGAGDGSLLLRLARAIGPQWRGLQLTLLDRRPCVGENTLQAFRELGWHANVVCEDALEWARSTEAARYDLCVASLFLHHFEGDSLDGLLNGISRRSDAVVAIEPRRDAVAAAGSHLVAFLGANAITRGDAVKSVEAGFAATEIGDRWRVNDGDWWTDEFRAWPFSHAFMAVRRRAPGESDR